jgi:hypothetical protein
MGAGRYAAMAAKPKEFDVSEYEKTAKRIADAIRNRDDGMVIVDRQFEQLEHDIEDALTAAVAAERERTREWKERALRAEAEAMTLRDFERSRNTVNRQTKAEAEL